MHFDSKNFEPYEPSEKDWEEWSPRTCSYRLTLDPKDYSAMFRLGLLYCEERNLLAST